MMSHLLLSALLIVDGYFVMCTPPPLDTSLGSSNKDVQVCLDWRGEVVAVNSQYTLYTEPCQRCTCHSSGLPVRCTPARCTPPPNCRLFEQVPGRCCQFNCLRANRSGGTNGTVTSGEATYGHLTFDTMQSTPNAPLDDIDGDILVCHDWKGEVVAVNSQYTPTETDPCQTCTCHPSGFPLRCTSARCDPPPDCRMFEQVPGQCCQFNCVLPTDRPGGTNGTFVNGTVQSTQTDVGFNGTLLLKLIATTITLLLITTLVMFMILRLRRWRELVMIRRLVSRPPVDIEYPPYEDPPPPYTVHKHPSEISPPTGEAPPPYEAYNNPNLPAARLVHGASRPQHSRVARLSQNQPNSDCVQFTNVQTQQNMATMDMNTSDNQTNRGNSGVQRSNHCNMPESIGACANPIQSHCCCCYRHCTTDSANLTCEASKRNTSVRLTCNERDLLSRTTCSIDNEVAGINTGCDAPQSSAVIMPNRPSPVGSSMTDLPVFIGVRWNSTSSTASTVSVASLQSTSSSDAVSLTGHQAAAAAPVQYDLIDDWTLPNDALYMREPGCDTCYIAGGSAECLLMKSERRRLEEDSRHGTPQCENHPPLGSKRTPPDGCCQVTPKQAKKHRRDRSDHVVSSPVRFTNGEHGGISIGVADDRVVEQPKCNTTSTKKQCVVPESSPPRPRPRLVYKDEVADVLGAVSAALTPDKQTSQSLQKTPRECKRSASCRQTSRQLDHELNAELSSQSQLPSRPCRGRRRSIGEPGDHFKQYGFIDDPVVLRQKRKSKSAEHMNHWVGVVKRRSSSLEESRPRSKSRKSHVHRRTRSSGNDRADGLREGDVCGKNRDSLGSSGSTRRRSSGSQMKRNVSRDTRHDEYAQRRREHKKYKQQLQKQLLQDMTVPTSLNHTSNVEENVSVC